MQKPRHTEIKNTETSCIKFVFNQTKSNSLDMCRARWFQFLSVWAP